MFMRSMYATNMLGTVDTGWHMTELACGANHLGSLFSTAGVTTRVCHVTFDIYNVFEYPHASLLIFPGNAQQVLRDGTLLRGRRPSQPPRVTAGAGLSHSVICGEQKSDGHMHPADTRLQLACLHRPCAPCSPPYERSSETLAKALALLSKFFARAFLKLLSFLLHNSLNPYSVCICTTLQAQYL